MRPTSAMQWNSSKNEGTHSSFSGVAAVISAHGLVGASYTDRGSPYWFTPEAGGKIDRRSPTQFGRIMQQLEIEIIAACSLEARGALGAGPSHAPGSAAEGVRPGGHHRNDGANRYLKQHYLPAFNAKFRQASLESGSAFVPCAGTGLKEILCEHFARRIGPDNCVSFEGRTLQIPAQRHRCHFVKAQGHCIGISMTPWPFSMAPDAWPATGLTGNASRESQRAA